MTAYLAAVELQPGDVIDRLGPDLSVIAARVTAVRVTRNRKTAVVDMVDAETGRGAVSITMTGNEILTVHR